MPKTIEALLEDIQLLGEEQFLVVEAVRTLVKQTIHPLSEEVKYGGILFSSEIQFGGVFAYKQHVSVEFSKGALITDAFGFLEGKGKGRRHIKLRQISDITTKHLSAYLERGVEAAKSAG
ncbi:DUF1801 domain-containing protein [Synechococcus sp. CS-602]|uniref:DUF1801 domain-containing protein n=1 Tax=Synechococcaceae TaxID=1890426 RepID=UPI0008FF435C|nr:MULTISPECIES: DUF1801 domain-containing protein [Synechococcaceae]MCT4364988.1 DUF1801 domain-containing protein [Candidatus Regnicoccus frigidus MAG-AL1]APD47856.1 hypothetical protein BM449_05785 [Synechococcus sp. SynAce01]MCT0202957.1 DUF1801 domain-containing protein [Synechococcus sp. CS-603]MCT0205810.1 DUF1801 domain-containing protein [Synechococcus sp. CS-602]MCT0245216.1 DUF1801 domain-containing protein [Synechococcus sp. CS-601]